MLSFLSPCVLPLVPGYVSMVSGLSAAELEAGGDRGRRRRSALRPVLRGIGLFVAGFTLVFVALGGDRVEPRAPAPHPQGRARPPERRGDHLPRRRHAARRPAGRVWAHAGSGTLGVVTRVTGERRFDVRPSRLGVWAAPVMGMAFAFAWTPCIGPVLGVVLGLATRDGTLAGGVLLLFAYSLGLGVPFLLIGLAFGRITATLARVRHWLWAVDLVGGAILVVFGVLLLTDNVSWVSTQLSNLLHDVAWGASPGADESVVRAQPPIFSPDDGIDTLSVQASQGEVLGEALFGRLGLVADLTRPGAGPAWNPGTHPPYHGAKAMAPVVQFRAAVALSGRFPALAGVDLSLEVGEVVVVEGANGAGKTSLLRVCAGLVPVASGQAAVLGFDLDHGSHRRPPPRRAPLPRLPPLRRPDRGGERPVRRPGRRGCRRRPRIDPALERLGLTGRLLTTPAGRLSAGQRRRVALAVLVARWPELWLLDEPHAGPRCRRRGALLDELIAEAVAGGATVVIASHEPELVEPLADRVVTVAGGRVTARSRGCRRATLTAVRPGSRRGRRGPTGGARMWRDAVLVAGKDLRIEARSRVALSQVVPFALLVLVLFAFALGPDRRAAPRAAGPVLGGRAVLHRAGRPAQRLGRVGRRRPRRPAALGARPGRAVPGQGGRGRPSSCWSSRWCWGSG